MMSSFSPDISVVIPTLGKSAHLRGLLERLQRQATDFTFEVLVVANIPQQSLRNLVNSMGAIGQGRFEYLETGRLGANLARNKGIERARGPILLFLDDDAILDTDTFLTRHLEYHRKHTDAAAIGGPYRLTPSHSKWDSAYHHIAHEWLARYVRKDHQTSQLLGGNMSIKKSVLDLYGWKFDDEIGFGGAETGLCHRMALAHRGLLFFEDLEIGHAPDLNRMSFCRKAFLQGAGARWREKKFAPLDVVSTNQFKKPSLKISPSVAAAQRLYHRCFDFGWQQSAYDDVDFHKPIPSFSYVRYALHRLTKLRPYLRVRTLHRSWYVALRSAWINSETTTSSSKLPNTAD